MKQRVVLLLFATILGSISLSSYRDGYAFNGSDGSGATSAAGCTCHNTTNALNTTVELDSAGVPVTSYVPGGSYTVKITATHSSATSWPKYGFQLASVKAAGSGSGSAQQAGTWSSTLPANVHQISLSIPIIEHNTPINATSGTGGSGTTYTQTIPWTAPASGTGSIKLYGIINAVNGNNGSNGDGYKAATAKTITEVVAPVTAGVSIAVTQGSNTICAGSSVSFTATPTNGGTTPFIEESVGVIGVLHANCVLNGMNFGHDFVSPLPFHREVPQVCKCSGGTDLVVRNGRRFSPKLLDVRCDGNSG